MPDDDKPRYATLSGVDPYVDWVLGAGRDFYFPPGQDEWMTVLVRLINISPAEFADGKPFAEGSSENNLWKQSVIVPDLYTQGLNANRKDGANCFALVTEAFFKFLEKPEGLRKFAAHVELSLPLDRNALPLPEKPKAKSKAKARARAKAKARRRRS